jgi:hypothetical protein
LLLFDVGLRAGSHETKVKVEAGAREEFSVKRVGSKVGFAGAGVKTDFAGVKRMNITMEARRETGCASLEAAKLMHARVTKALVPQFSSQHLSETVGGRAARRR